MITILFISNSKVVKKNKKKSGKNLKKNKTISKPAAAEIRNLQSVQQPIRSIVLKFSLLAVIVLLVLLFSDLRGYFNPDNVNNHTLKKWNAYYAFTEKNDVDVLLVGNSHLYTGINPKNLSAALGCNAFILASPGTHVDDHYYALKEAIKLSKPKLVVLETYGFKAVEAKGKSKGPLSDQFKSFSARKNIPIKFSSMFSLFAVKNYGYAWSNTLRNHDYLYTNYERIEKNIKNKNKTKDASKELYLGRYVRFQTGIEDSTLMKYKNIGAPVKGLEYETNSLQADYIEDIINLCNSNDIELIFLTLPMYDKHISDYTTWKSKLKESIGDTYSSDEYWIDMQMGSGYSGFNRNDFENTYASNQHMTYRGSLKATYKLVDFIQDKERINLPNRKNDKDWIDLFYGEEGFLENNQPKKNDKNNAIIYSSTSEIVKEIIVTKNGKNSSIIAKVKPESAIQRNNLSTKKIRITLDVNVNGSLQSRIADLQYDTYHSSNSNLNFKTNISPIEIVKVRNIEFTN